VIVVAVPLAALLLGILIILIGWGALALGRVLAKALGGVPVVGGWLSGNVEGAINAIAQVMVAELDTYTAAAGWLFALVANNVWELLNWVSSSIAHGVALAASAKADAANALAQIPQAAQWAVNTADAWADRVLAQAQAWYNAAVGLTYTLYNQAVTVVQDYYNQAVAHADAVANSALNTAETDLHNTAASLQANINALSAALGGDVTALVRQIDQDLTVAIATAEQAAAAALADANAFARQVASSAATASISALDQAAHDVVIGPWAALLPELETLAGALPAEVGQAIGLPGVLGEAIPASIPGILAMTIPAVAAVAAEVDSCLVPNCDTLNGLRGVTSLFGEAALWAVLVELLTRAAHSPAAAADDLAGPVADAINGAVGGIRNLVGV
jgi:hypothetical protein